MLQKNKSTLRTSLLIMIFLYYSGGAEGNTDNMIDEILTEQLRLSKLRLYHSDTYKLLNILRCMQVKILKCENTLY